MQQPSSVRLLILDFGYPMNKSAVEKIKTSLLNVVSLLAAYTENFYTDYLEISIINSEAAIINNSSWVQYFKALKKLLNATRTNATINVKITIQEYKKILKTSLEKIVGKFGLHTEKLDTEECTSINSYDNVKIKVMIMTKKTASLLNFIIKDVVNQFKKLEYLANLISMVRFKIVQISNEDEVIPKFLKSMFVENIICHSYIEELNILFKDFLYKSACDPDQVHIIISKDVDLIVKCEVHDRIINPALLRLGFDVELPTKQTFLNLYLSSVNLEVLFKVPISNICSTLIFGFSRRAYASNSDFLTLNQLQFNQQIFRVLCESLADSEQGLLAESKFHFQTCDLRTYFFLTTDGNGLLLNYVAPEELLLFNRPEIPKNLFPVEEYATKAMQKTLQQVRTLEAVSPTMFSSGLYERLKTQLSGAVRNKNLIYRENKHCNEKSQRKIKRPDAGSGRDKKKDKNFFSNIQNKKISAREKTKNENEFKKTTLVKPKNVDNVHPALLSPKTTKQYRKNSVTDYQLPELSLACTEN